MPVQCSLEDGRLTDGKGETVNFSDTFIVFTSNIGASEIKPNEDAVEQFKIQVTKHFVHQLKRPELLGRIGEANIEKKKRKRTHTLIVYIFTSRTQTKKDRHFLC